MPFSVSPSCTYTPCYGRPAKVGRLFSSKNGGGIMPTKHTGGRPPRYKNKAEIEALIEAYFIECRDQQRPPTVTGLALALGFTSRQALLNYQAKREFVDTITRAKSRIEQYAEERLFDRDGTAGAQFSLKNNFTGWNREKEIDAESTEKLIERVGQLLGATDSVID